MILKLALLVLGKVEDLVAKAEGPAVAVVDAAVVIEFLNAIFVMDRDILPGNVLLC